SVPELLPASSGEPDDSTSGTIFKIECGARGEKVAYVRLNAGTVRVSDLVELGPGRTNKVKAIEVFDEGSATPTATFSAGAVAKVWGLVDGRLGDRLGTGRAVTVEAQFPPPTLEAVVAPIRPRD